MIGIVLCDMPERAVGILERQEEEVAQFLREQAQGLSELGYQWDRKCDNPNCPSVPGLWVGGFVYHATPEIITFRAFLTREGRIVGVAKGSDMRLIGIDPGVIRSLLPNVEQAVESEAKRLRKFKNSSHAVAN